MEPLSYFMIVLACLVFSAFFSASETALLRIRQHELQEDIDKAHGPAALAVRELVSSTSRLLVTILFGNNVVNILAAAVASTLAVRYLGETYGIAVATIVLTVTIFLFCELVPKTIAARYPRRVGYSVALPLYLFHKAVTPFHALYDRSVAPLLKAIGKSAEETPMSASEEVMRLARALDEPGASALPSAIISAAAHAAETTVIDIMVPRTEIVAFPVEIEASDLLDNVLEERYTRVLIFEGSIDNIIGLAHLKDLVQLARTPGDGVRSILKPVLRVPERKEILPLLAEMQRTFVHVAVVTDEFGVTLGMVTQEDILEELVGEIRDEFDREELSTIRQVGPGRYQALGRIKVVDFNRETGLNVEAERGDTLAGLVFNTLGRAARRGESVRVPGYKIVVADVSGSRIGRVQVIEESAEEASAS